MRSLRFLRLMIRSMLAASCTQLLTSLGISPHECALASAGQLEVFCLQHFTMGHVLYIACHAN